MGVPSIHTAPRLLFLGVRTKTVATLFWNRTVKCPALYQIVLVKSPLCLIFFAISMTNPITIYSIYIQYIHLPYIIITIYTNTCSSRKMTGFISSCCFIFVFKPFDIPMVEIIAPYDTVGQLDC